MATTKVLLDCDSIDAKAQPFDVDHAERLLRLEEKEGRRNWKVSTEEKIFEYIDGTIKHRSDTIPKGSPLKRGAVNSGK